VSKKLPKHGNSLALIIRPVTKRKVRSKEEIKKIAQEIINEYADVFKKLAE
jgi:hypothetical protein